MKFRLRQGTIPTKPRFRSVPDVMVLNSPFRFLRNCLLSTNVFQGASYGIVPCLKLVFCLFYCEDIALEVEKEWDLLVLTHK